MKRRNFMTAFASGLLSLGLSGNGSSGSRSSVSFPNESISPKVMKYNPLGNTGLNVSDVSCGAISLFEPNVLRYAYECGVNFFDTGESYLRTKSETYVGQALQDVRDKVIIATKYIYDFSQKIDKSSVIQRVEASLKRLQSDYVDIAMVHMVEDLSPTLKNEEILSAYAQLKKEGKIRFSGFSTHNGRLTLKQALDTDFGQIILFVYNHLEGQPVESLIKAVRQKGIGTVAMKVFAGGMHGSLKSMVGKETSYPQAAIQWVLGNPDVDCCLTTMSTYSHVEEYLGASARPLQRSGARMIASYQAQASGFYCRVSCQECLSACPNHVAINDILRYAMYFDHYGMEKEALRYYAGLQQDKKPLNCSGCAGYCERACPYSLRVKSRLLRSHQILTA